MRKKPLRGRMKRKRSRGLPEFVTEAWMELEEGRQSLSNCEEDLEEILILIEESGEESKAYWLAYKAKRILESLVNDDSDRWSELIDLVDELKRGHGLSRTAESALQRTRKTEVSR